MAACHNQVTQEQASHCHQVATSAGLQTELPLECWPCLEHVGAGSPVGSASLFGSLLQRERSSPGDGLGREWEWEEEPGWGGHVKQVAVESHK